MSTYAIGDIHGCYDELVRLVDKIDPISGADNFVFLGDYIDRGPKSKEVIDYLIGLSKSVDCVFLMGNHEDMLLRVLNTPGTMDNTMAISLWYMNGGIKTVESYKERWREKIKKHEYFLRSLKHIYIDDNYIYVHAGINPNKELHEQDTDDLLWIRDEFIYCDTQLEKKIIYGHTVTEQPHVQKDKIGIDTGCVFYGKLTAIKLPEEEFIYS